MDRGARVLVSIHTRTRTNAAIHSPTTRTTREGCPAARSTSAAAAPSGTIVDVVGAETRHRMDCGLMHFPQQFTGCTTRGRSRASGGPARLGGKCSTSPVRACGVLGLCWGKCDFVFVLDVLFLFVHPFPHTWPGRAVKPGVTTDEIDRIVYEACMERCVGLEVG